MKEAQKPEPITLFPSGPSFGQGEIKAFVDPRLENSSAVMAAINRIWENPSIHLDLEKAAYLNIRLGATPDTVVIEAINPNPGEFLYKRF